MGWYEFTECKNKNSPDTSYGKYNWALLWKVQKKEVKMKVKKYINRYKKYASKEMARRKTAISKVAAERTKVKKQINTIRRKAFLEESKRQALIRGKMEAKRKYGTGRLARVNAALGNPYGVKATPKNNIVKKIKKRKKKTKPITYEYIRRKV